MCECYNTLGAFFRGLEKITTVTNSRDVPNIPACECGGDRCRRLIFENMVRLLKKDDMEVTPAHLHAPLLNFSTPLLQILLRARAIQCLFRVIPSTLLHLAYNNFREMDVPFWVWLTFSCIVTTEKALCIATERSYDISTVSKIVKVAVTDSMMDRLLYTYGRTDLFLWLRAHRCEGCLGVSDNCFGGLIAEWEVNGERQTLVYTVCSPGCLKKLKKGFCNSCHRIETYQSKRLNNYVVKNKFERDSGLRFCSKECQRVFHKGPSRPQNIPDYLVPD